jgi:hypothetical protein
MLNLQKDLLSYNFYKHFQQSETIFSHLIYFLCVRKYMKSVKQKLNYNPK